MIIIDSPAALAAARGAGHVSPALLDLVAGRMAGVVAAFAEAGATWDPDENGAFAILEPGDGAAAWQGLGLDPEEGLAGACWESCYRHSGPAQAWELLFLFHNDGGWTVFIPMDADLADARLVAKLEDEATDPPEGLEAAPGERAPF